MEILYYEGPVKAGFPSPALDHIEERVSLDKELIKHPLSTFLVDSTGDSMINAFIPPKSRLLIDRSLVPKNGDIILAVVNGDFTVKFFKKNDVKCWLIPANSKYREIEINGETDFEVWGVVTTIITDTKNVRACML